MFLGGIDKQHWAVMDKNKGNVVRDTFRDFANISS